MSDKGFNLNIGNIRGEQVNVGENVTATQNNYWGKQNSYLNEEILHIIGEASFGQVDAEALKNGGIKSVVVDTSVEPYLALFTDELERQRSDNKVMKLWHFSGHGDAKKGLLFGEQWINWEQFNQLLTVYDELEILFIAACSSVKVADAVSGKFKYVLACAIDVPDTDATIATETFWKNIVRGKSAEEAFEATKLVVPQFAPNLRLRGL